jgi:signal transduction histidine kinase
MTASVTKLRNGPLDEQLRWFIALRWLVVVILVIGAMIEHWWQLFDGQSSAFFAIATATAGYNFILRSILPTVRGAAKLQRLAFAQLVLDLIVLTALMMWTGGVRSPLIGFFVFHMVFASLLLPQAAAYASAAAACTLIACGLALTHAWPTDSSEQLTFAGFVVTLVLTVMLTNRITRDLRAHRRRLRTQNRRVVAMSKELRRQQQTLIQHEKMVALGRMAAGVTHEITNPLAGIDSILQLAQRRPEKLNAETVQTLRQQVQRINQIILQMKLFSHPTEIQLTSSTLNDVVEQALEMIRFDKRIRNVEVQREFDLAAPPVAMSPQALQQVLVNLIINALDAMAATPQPILTLRTRRREEWCIIEVADNGHGIDAQNMSHLFEPFFTTKPVGQGTGLGLSISYSLMEKQGGSISVRSKLGGGTTFTVRLPVAADRSRARESSQASIGGAENATP